MGDQSLCWTPFIKCLSTTLALRLKPVLNNLLGAEQKTYILGSFILQCTRNTYDVLHSSKQNYLPGIILRVDFKKAFDIVSFEFILTTLDLFNFGENFKQWIKIISAVEENTSFIAVTVINGKISKPFSLH